MIPVVICAPPLMVTMHEAIAAGLCFLGGQPRPIWAPYQLFPQMIQCLPCKKRRVKT